METARKTRSARTRSERTRRRPSCFCSSCLCAVFQVSIMHQLAQLHALLLRLLVVPSSLVRRNHTDTPSRKQCSGKRVLFCCNDGGGYKNTRYETYVHVRIQYSETGLQRTKWGWSRRQLEKGRAWLVRRPVFSLRDWFIGRSRRPMPSPHWLRSDKKTFGTILANPRIS